VIERGEELVDGMRPERIADLWPVKSYPYDGSVVGAVIGDVGEVKTFHRMPQVWSKRAGHALKLAGSRSSSDRVLYSPVLHSASVTWTAHHLQLVLGDSY
jgi:hypothetical protein